MSYLFDGVDDHLTVASPADTAAPLTIAAWIKSGSSIAQQTVASVGDEGSIDNSFLLEVAGNLAGDPVRAGARSTTGQFGASTTAYSTGVWHHACAVFASDISRSGFIDGGSKGTNTVSRIPTAASIDTTTIGRRPDSLVWFNGRIAEVAIWNATLTDGEVADLGAGALPTDVQPGALVAYWPLRDDANDAIGTRHLTVTGAALDADHPRSAVTTDRDLVYTIMGNTVLVDRDLVYSIRNAVLTDRDLVYSIRNSVLSDRDLVYTIVEAIVSDRDFVYSILNPPPPPGGGDSDWPQPVRRLRQHTPNIPYTGE